MNLRPFTMTGILMVSVLSLFSAQSFAAGTLTPVNAGHQPMRIASHHVEVVINNGFAQTEVTQTFKNPNNESLEAVYAFPLPVSASLSEMSIITGEVRLLGEVVKKERAKKIYEEEKLAGRDAGLGTKESYQRFEFRVTPVPAGGQVSVRFVYYQPIQIDTGVGRFVYPLEEGGTDEAQVSFWSRNEKVDGSFSAHFTVRSAWPIDDVRLPGLGGAVASKNNEGEWEISYSATDANLNRDLVMYYRLAEDLPGRVEVLPYRDKDSKPGTFMMVLTPGVDLQPLKSGSDYVFVLDNSGSMSGKLHTLASGVNGALGSLNPEDRFRIVVFSSSARELTSKWIPATPKNVQSYSAKVAGIGPEGGTNIYAGLEEAFEGMDNDRATSVILVTDGVTNTDIVDPAEFEKLMKKNDVRVFGFLLGNSANWPLMKVICDSSGGYYTTVSNADDILGQIMQAKGKVVFEALHDVKLKIKGVKTYDVTDVPTKIYRGQQIVLFGRYEKGGKAELIVEASLTGQDKVYRTEFEFPKIDKTYPELERLWAMNKVEKIDHLSSTGKLKPTEATDAVADLGVAYQIVTDETAMIVLTDEGFKRHGVDRKNKERISREADAMSQRQDKAIPNHRVDRSRPAFPSRAPRHSGGGGALEPFDVAIVMLLALAAFALTYRRRKVGADE